MPGECPQEMLDMDCYIQAVSMLNAYTLPFVLRAMASLGVFDILYNSSGPLSVKDMVSQIKCEATSSVEDVIHRLLNYLAAFHVLREGPADHFSLTKLSTWLANAHPMSLAPFLKLLTSPEFQASWQFLDKVALEGGRVTGFEKAHGLHLYQMVGHNPTFNRIFNEGMTSLSSVSILNVIQFAGKSFTSIRRLVDVGGGNSHCITRIVEAYPHIQGVVYDLPHVVADAPKTPGIEYLSGDMFESVPCADGIFLKSVLHNWDDEKCKLLLKNCYDALPRNGKLIVVDVIVNPEKKNKGSNVDVAMIAVVGGRERSEDEFKALLAPQGFSDISFKYTASEEGILEACKM